jgi:hypothetical protein
MDRWSNFFCVESRDKGHLPAITDAIALFCLSSSGDMPATGSIYTSFTDYYSELGEAYRSMYRHLEGIFFKQNVEKRGKVGTSVPDSCYFLVQPCC